MIFLATDDADAVPEFRQAFGDRLICNLTAKRSVGGINEKLGNDHSAKGVVMVGRALKLWEHVGHHEKAPGVQNQFEGRGMFGYI